MNNPNDMLFKASEAQQSHAQQRVTEGDLAHEAETFGALYAQRQISSALWAYLSRASSVLLADALRYLQEGEDKWRLSVILSHAACDLQTEETLEQLVTLGRLDHLREALLGPWAPQLSLHREHVRVAYEGLSGEAPWRQGGPVAQVEWWDEWTKSVKRRDDVAHRGLKVTRDEASASHEACSKLVLYLQQAVDRARTKAGTSTAECSGTPLPLRTSAS